MTTKKDKGSQPADAEVLPPETETPTQSTGTFADDVPADLAGEGDGSEPRYMPERFNPGAVLDPSANAFDLSDVRLPYLSIVHPIGKLQDAGFPTAAMILNKDVLVADKGQELDVIILHAQRGLREYKYEEGRVSAWFSVHNGNVAAAKAEAKKAGFRTEWAKNPQGGPDLGPEVSDALQFTLLIRKPEKVSNAGLFGITVGDEHEYAICQAMADKQGYDPANDDIKLVAAGKLSKTGLYSGLWKLRVDKSKPTKGKGRQSLIFRFRFVEVLKPEVVAGIKAALSAPSNG